MVVLVYFDDPPDIMRFIEANRDLMLIGSARMGQKQKQDLCAEYSPNDYVEVVVTHGWHKGRKWTEILLENNYKREFENDAATPIRPAQESPSNTLVLESNEDDTVNDDATEIKSSRESHSNTSLLEATETETQNHEPVDGVELPLPHESDDMMDDVATPIIDPQEIPRGKIKSDDKIALPKRISEPGTNGSILDRINKHSNMKLVGTVENVLGREFKKLEDSFLAPVIKMGRRQKHMVFSRHLIHHLLLRRIDIGKKGLWFSFGEQLMRFSLREFHLATGLPCVVDKDEEEVETSATKNKKKDPWMKKNQTLNTLLNLLVKKSTYLTVDQRLRLGATILVEGILMASNPVDVKCILGDPELYNDLVEDVDSEFGRVVDLVKRGYRLKRQDWLNGRVDIAVAEAEVDENNSAPRIDATDQEKIEFLTKKVVSLEEKWSTLKGKKNGVRPPREVDHQEEDDTEVG
ncbi:hypothetical protein Bca52824_064840 [Brassica carinata]|uniref:DUF1985 domain-containing protein n=1 Tax=Brassica carinata TaxID=52824 RepID=A0A8X7U8L1_BRACI|nr:hypothetical protein Bca52824_064840 [Brassica carinata]